MIQHKGKVVSNGAVQWNLCLYISKEKGSSVQIYIHQVLNRLRPITSSISNRTRKTIWKSLSFEVKRWLNFLLHTRYMKHSKENFIFHAAFMLSPASFLRPKHLQYTRHKFKGILMVKKKKNLERKFDLHANCLQSLLYSQISHSHNRGPQIPTTCQMQTHVYIYIPVFVHIQTFIAGTT